MAVVNGWDVQPTLVHATANERSPGQAAGWFVTGAPLSQALIQRRRRLMCELRPCPLVILLSSALQPEASDSAVAQPTAAAFKTLVRKRIPTETRRHVTRRYAGLLHARIVAC